MGRAAVNYRFQSLPSAFRYFPRAVFGKRAALVPEGRAVPRLQGSAEQVSARRSHLARYRQVCRFADDGALPITYPHVLAMPLHVALLTHPLFVVRLMGLIHVANEIHQIRPLPANGEFRARCWVEGFRDGDRGHEFEVFTNFEDRDGTAWHEKSTLLARRGEAGGPPLAVVRRSVHSWPVSITMTDADAMVPGSSLAGAGTLDLVARISRSGQPTANSGDLYGELSYDFAATAPMSLIIDRIVP